MTVKYARGDRPIIDTCFSRIWSVQHFINVCPTLYPSNLFRKLRPQPLLFFASIMFFSLPIKLSFNFCIKFGCGPLSSIRAAGQSQNFVNHKSILSVQHFIKILHIFRNINESQVSDLLTLKVKVI